MMEQEVHSIVKTEEKRLYNTGKYLQMSREGKGNNKTSKKITKLLSSIHPTERGRLFTRAEVSLNYKRL